MCHSDMRAISAWVGIGLALVQAMAELRPLADELLGDIRPIGIGGIDEIDFELRNSLKGSDRLCSICGRTPDAPTGEAHRPEAETIDLDLATDPE